MVMKPKRPTSMFVPGLAPRKIGGMEMVPRYFAIALDAAGWDSALCLDRPVADEFRRYFGVRVEYEMTSVEK